MGIFRAGVRVTRPLSPAPSSSSSDDEEVVVHKHKVRKSIDKSSKIGVLPCITKDASDHYQVGESICQLPHEIFELSNLGDILSLQSWNECLSEQERQQLSAYLPVMDLGSFQENLREVLSAQNMYFGSPMEHLWQQLAGGLCNPTVVRTHQTLTALQKREYYHDLRCYHNGMVNSLMEMRELWMSDPDANLEEKLGSWNEWKSSKVACIKGLKACEDRGKTECISRPVGISNAGSLISNHIFRGSNEELALHSDLESDQVFDRTITQPTPHSIERVQNQVDADQPETSSVHKINSSLSDSALSEGSHVKRMSTPQEHFERRSKKRKRKEGNGKEFRAIASWEYENAYLSKVQKDGHRDSGLNASEMMVRESNGGMHHNKELEKCISSTGQRDWSRSPVIKLMKSAQFTFVPPLTPGFTFSTLYFLSAVRASLFDDTIPDGVECLPFREIVARVEACPGDRRVLSAQLPLDCLVRGALKVLALTSKSPAMDNLKPLVSYDKSRSYWSWIGTLSGDYCTFKEVDLQAMSEVWRISAETLNELLDIFEKWLKNKERTLQQLWKLAQIPLPAFPVFPDENERFRELRAQKGSTTLLPSSYEMRALFQKEERVRYSTLEIAFRYTTADGQKSAVAPLRKLGGKSRARARDHFMLRSDRPSHITILCLVRDAAARLPQGIGTRSDVCILLRDSQFIEDVSEAQLSQVVSGALDRLHYERDPCVRYDQDKKLWLYLHGEREEEDFEEGGTASTRSSRRSKKEGGAATVSPAQGNGFDDDMSEPESGSGSFSGLNDARKSASPEFLYEHDKNGAMPSFAGGQGREEVLLPFIDVSVSMQPFCGTTECHPMGWEVYKAGKELSITH
ncbi:hypothetical protein GOP47_0006697 [Adiantum capillus-veneris]|uniref:DEUBAD domain-containing protein n=1 Tax=Adiantum capillus-veneris TaxID=13818 RepID=A0A9D4V444_ADICA|nr:hypothetical protein GOP47_0006697 [Adiantum capillus-veneris]